MPKYSDRQLAQEVQRVIYQTYGTSDVVQSAFFSRLKEIAQKLSLRQLIDEEINAHTRTMAQSVVDKLRFIELSTIELRMSAAIRQKAQQEEFNLQDHEADFKKMAKQLVGDLISAMNKANRPKRK
jgi:predicted DNA-binding ribbon-helix-helix protein